LFLRTRQKQRAGKTRRNPVVVHRRTNRSSVQKPAPSRKNSIPHFAETSVLNPFRMQRSLPPWCALWEQKYGHPQTDPVKQIFERFFPWEVPPISPLKKRSREKIIQKILRRYVRQ